MKLVIAILFFTTLKYNGIAPVEETSTIYVFLDQNFQSEVCEAEDAPVWSINSTDLISATDVQRYNGRVHRDYNNVTGERQATLILNWVNSSLNGSVITCTAGLTPILTYTLVVVNTTIKWVMPHETFTSPVCKSPLTESRAPNWIINGIALNDTIVISRYGAEVRRFGGDSKGRRQAQLTLHSMTKVGNGSNITCAVGSELRMVYILYIVPGEEEKTTTPGSTGADAAVEANNATGAATLSNTVRNTSVYTLIAIGCVAGLAFAVLVIIVVVVVRNRRKSRQISKVKLPDREPIRRRSEEPRQPEEVESDGVIPTYPSDERQELLRQRTSVRRDTEVCEGEVPVEGLEQDVRLHCENVSAERVVCGGTVAGILEMSQGQEHATAIVFEDKVHLQGMPDKPLKCYLTEDDLPSSRTEEEN